MKILRGAEKRRESRNLYLSRVFFLLCLSVWSWPWSLPAAAEVTIHFFWAPNCPACAEQRPLLEDLARRNPEIVLREYDIWNERDSLLLLQAVANATGQPLVSTPATVVGDRLWVGYSGAMAAEIEQSVRACLAASCPDLVAQVREGQMPPVEEYPAAAPPSTPATTLVLPLLGEIDPERLSLPLLTVSLGLLDSFNPCAFFVLLFLLSMLVHARSRRTMLLVGGTFVFFSGFIYFLFMAAWLNLFLVVGQLPLITFVAGCVALVVAGFNIKDFFLFHRGPTLSIPEQTKPQLFARMRHLLQARSIPAVLLGTIVLAIAANTYELLCTAGLPMVYTRILTLHGLAAWQYYAFIAFYNIVYILPLLAIVLLFVITLGAYKLSEWQGRLLKLVSGMMLLVLGLVLISAPGLLNRAEGAVGALLVALIAASCIALLQWRREYRQEDG